MPAGFEEGSSVEHGGAALSGGGSLGGPTRALRQPSSPDSLAFPQQHLMGLEGDSEVAAVAGPDALVQPAPAPGVAEGEPLRCSRPPSLSALIPLAEVAGGGADAPGASENEPDSPLLGLADDEQDGHSGGGTSSCGMDSSAHDGQEHVDAGYVSSDDMDFMSMRHCINCTGDMWGSVCRACGYVDGHEASIFDPLVPPPRRTSMLAASGSAVISYDDRMLLHDENLQPLHPERADRLRAVMARLDAAQLTGRCRRLPSREATPQEVERCHIPELLSAVNILSDRSKMQGNLTLHWPTSDTYVNQHTAFCARLSAGACVDVAVAVARGEAASGVAIVRPPGHHAESNTAMGFCFFNNAGIAARAAQAAGAGRVLIVDWDIHHGNGTQHIFDSDPSVMYMSLHRYDGGQFYPGTGAATEVGCGEAEGRTVNVPWPCGGMRNGDYMAAFQHVILPIAHEYAPDLVIISAGFDAAEGDPIGGCLLTPEVYGHMTAMLQTVAPTVLILEGGYNLLSVAKSTEACVRVLLGERPPQLPAQQPASAAGMAAIAQTLRVQSRYWRSVGGLLARLVPPSTADTLTEAAEAAGLEGVEEPHSEEVDEDTDTPHVAHGRCRSEFAPSGSGWESDLEPQSGASLGEDSLGQQEQHRHPYHQQQAQSLVHPQQTPEAAVEERGATPVYQGSQLRTQQGYTSDTELETEQSLGEAEEEEEESEGQGAGGQQLHETAQQPHSSQLHISPQVLHEAVLDPPSPDLLPLREQPSLSAGALPCSSLGALAGGCSWNAAAGAAAAEVHSFTLAVKGSAASPSAGAAHRWRKLALKVVAMKRAGPKALRLSPQLVREALDSAAAPSCERAAS
ncbi:hypothetical protein N2152v2_008361 [Parachlorella kessleri]